MNSFIEKLTQFSTKIANNKVLKIIQRAFMLLLPISMTGGFIALFNGIALDGYQSFLVSTGIKNILTVIYQWTVGMLALYLAFLIAYQYARENDLKNREIAIGLTSLVCFLIVTPYIPGERWDPSMIPTSWLGASGMFTAIIVSFAVGAVFTLCRKYHFEIRLPESVPPFIANQFTSLIPVALNLILFGILNTIFVKTSFGSVHQLIYSAVAMPVRAVSTNVFGGWVLMVFLYLLWFCGIHGGMTVGPIIGMLFTQIQLENQMAYQAGLPLPHMYVGDALTYGTGSLPLLVAALIFAKSEQCKTISRLGFIPAVFGVDEPAYFGMPMILNPLFFVPWVILSPTIAVFGTHLLKLVGLLGYSNATGGARASNLPFFVGNMMNYGVPGLIWGTVMFVLIVLVYVPFFRAYDKQKLEEEKGQQE